MLTVMLSLSIIVHQEFWAEGRRLGWVFPSIWSESVEVWVNDCTYFVASSAIGWLGPAANTQLGSYLTKVIIKFSTKHGNVRRCEQWDSILLPGVWRPRYLLQVSTFIIRNKSHFYRDVSTTAGCTEPSQSVTPAGYSSGELSRLARPQPVSEAQPSHARSTNSPGS